MIFFGLLASSGLTKGWVCMDYQWISLLLSGILENIKYIISIHLQSRYIQKIIQKLTEDVSYISRLEKPYKLML